MKMAKTLIYFLAIVGLFWLSLLRPELKLATNLASFITWATFIVYPIVALSKNPGQELLDSYRNGEHLPAWADRVLYSAIIYPLAAFGHYWMAVAWIIIWACDAKLRNESKKKI